MPRKKRPQHPLSRLCDESPHPIYALDDQRRIVACNPACAEWLGLPADQLIGQRCDYATNETGSAENAAAAALCPPPQTFLGEQTHGSIVWRKEEQVETRTATFIPLSSEESAAVLVILGAVQVTEPDASQSAENTPAANLHHRLQQLSRRMRAPYRLDGLVGDSPSIRRVREQVGAAIASQVRVLVVGPPGSGREHVARTIIYARPSGNDRPLLPLQGESLDLEMLRSAVSSLVPGDSDSTLLVLDVDQLGPAEQVELVGALRSTNFRARMLTTARRPLIELAAEGSFHRELAFELSPLVVELPALLERREDIPLLAQKMVEEYNASGGRQLAGFAPAALDRLASLPWTGNVEELSRVVREACHSVNTVWIGESDLPPYVRAVVSAGLHPRHEPENIQLDEFLLEVEKELMERALRRAKGNKAQAARLLGISRARLLRRLQQLGLISRDEPVIEFHPED